jgi:GH15 family glucan-1,4-alpha-glucosidase
MAGYKKLEDYGLIGNLSTCALVGNDGSIDWCCFPHIESPSLFAALLDADKGGHFSIRPLSNYQSQQHYIENTNVLETVFATPSGTVNLTDFMPVGKAGEEGQHGGQTIIRKVTCTEGSVKMELDFKPKFDYARVNADLIRDKTGILVVHGEERIFLFSPIYLQIRSQGAVGPLTIEEGNTVWFALQYGYQDPLTPDGCLGCLEETLEYWNAWRHQCEADKCVFSGPWHDLIIRSGLVLKLLIHKSTGSICAAPTTSLPEEIGGVRNWDYRYNWIRDASFTVQALFNMGHIDEAENYLNWFLDICRGVENPSDIQIMYGLHGETELKEVELDHLCGYKDSRPVRIGNRAAQQKQLDIYGEIVNAIYEISRYNEGITEEQWVIVRRVVDYVCEVWDTPDSGIWEVRKETRHFLYSKLMCWVALDRGIRIGQEWDETAVITKWESVRELIRTAILNKGFSRKMKSFVQSFDSDILDATNLLIPMMGFLPFEDPRVQGTINATMEYLMVDKCLVYRYLGDDGLPGKEGAFILCTFWLVDTLTLSGRIHEAKEIFVNILKYVSPLGLLAEEIDPETGHQLGNFPQAFSHIGLINSALYLGGKRGKKHVGPELLGRIHLETEKFE